MTVGESHSKSNLSRVAAGRGPPELKRERETIDQPRRHHEGRRKSDSGREDRIRRFCEKGGKV